MEKKEFSFYQDVKVTCWVRQYFDIEAESKEEALEMAEKYIKEDIGSSSDSHMIYETEWLTDTWEYITPEDDGGAATIELFDAETKEMVGDNSITEELSAASQEEPRKHIGYQIKFEDDEWPEGLFSFQVFRDKRSAMDLIDELDLPDDRLVEIYEGDVEEPTFIGRKPRFFKEGEKVFNCEPSPADEDLRDWAVVCYDTEVEYGDDIVLLTMDSGSENETDADSVYQIAEGKVCPRCGGQLCYEHNDEIDYPYFCPACDENFYGIEVG